MSSKRKIPHLGPIGMPSHFDVKIRTLDENRVELNYVERHPPVTSEASPERREIRATVVDEPTRVFGYLFREFLGCYLTAGGDPFRAVRMVVNLEALRRGVMLVEKSFFELPGVERAVIMDEDLVRGMLGKASTEDLLKIKGVVEQELKRRGG